MGFLVLADGAIVADTLDEAIALQRRIRETPAAGRKKRIQGSGSISQNPVSGLWRFRLRPRAVRTHPRTRSSDATPL